MLNRILSHRLNVALNFLENCSAMDGGMVSIVARFLQETGELHGWPLICVVRTLQHNLGYDAPWVFEKRVYKVKRIVIACVVALRDPSKLAFSQVYVLCKPVHAFAVCMLFNLSIT